MKHISILLLMLITANLAHAKFARCVERDGNFSSVSIFNSWDPFFEQTLTMNGEAIANTLVNKRVVCLERREDIDECTKSESNTGGVYNFTYECGPRARFTMTLNKDGTGLATCSSAFFPNDQRELIGCQSF